ncbi:PilN domain-containing protein [Bacillus sp. 1P02SD]|uniref:PilN domain-containing protein n=1 Tax=Bacillus sp. 1P02SD TaxID=3132264 RepID=UPI0039A00B86
MLVNINLLPRKEFKNRAKLLLLIIVISVALIGFLLIFIQYKQATSQEKQLEKQIATLQETRGVVEQKNDSANQSNNVIYLEKTVEWADRYFVETVQILNHLTMLLPDRGFVQNFSYTEDGIVSLEVQFDTNTENAHYLALLTDSPFIESARLLTVSTTPITDTGEGTDTTTETPDTNNNAKENMGTTDNKIESEQNNNILPRYYAEYEIIFDKSAIKSMQEGK